MLESSREQILSETVPYLLLFKRVNFIYIDIM